MFDSGVFTLLLWDDYSRFQIETKRAGRVSHDELIEFLSTLAAGNDQIDLQPVGKSFQGRDIFSVRLGNGPIKIALWSQMHGNEPTHTVVLLELLNLLTSGESVAGQILDKCSLVIIPMLNPDGAAGWTRVNGQGIDINRDARRLSSPEAKILASMIDGADFDFAFNLHNQRRSRTVDGRHLAAISLLVPSVDATHSEKAWITRGKRLGSLIRRVTEPHCRGMISRYGAGFMPRCFGERVSSSGVCTLLIEAGAGPELDRDFLTQLHFFALVSALLGIAKNQIESESPAGFESLPVADGKDLYDVLVRNVCVKDARFEITNTDIGVQREFGSEGEPIGMIVELGDLDDHHARESIDGTGLIATCGRTAFDRRLVLGSSDMEIRIEEAVKLGVTSLFGAFSIGDDEACRAFVNMREMNFPIDIGWLAILSRPEDSITTVREAELAQSMGALGLIGDVTANEAQTTNFADALPIPQFTYQELHSFEVQYLQTNVDDFATSEQVSHRIFSRHPPAIRLGHPANLALFEHSTSLRPTHLIVRSIVVVRDGQLLVARPGIVLS